jgi:2-C-methyl-D-erythritol 2,4-cyclodiphosphate synthase
MRVGHGWDSHRLGPGRPFVLGGVSLPSETGPLGHSDGDALLHALTDAVLGAAGLGDIGSHFADTDPRWEGMESEHFLKAALAWAGERSLHPLNADVTVILEKPKLGPHRQAIVARLAELLELPVERVNLKAKTAEGLGPVGEGLSVECHAVVLLGGDEERGEMPVPGGR